MFEEISIPIWLTFLFTMLFVLGAVVGSFLNVIVARLPTGRSLLGPRSHCGSCGYLIPLRENLPLISYWRLRGRCSACSASFSMRYFWIELLTGLGFVAIYFFEIGWQPTSFYEFGGFWYLSYGVFPPYSWPIFLYHALLFIYLIVAAAIGLEHGWVPRWITVLAVCVGVAGSALMSWPFPADSFAQWHLDKPIWTVETTRVSPGVQLAPVWGPLPGWLPANSVSLGMATSLIGAGTGLLLARALFFPAERGPGMRSPGAGEADFLAGAGAFLGWQPLAVAAVLSTAILMLVYSIARFWSSRRPTLLSPILAATVFLVWLAWSRIGRLTQPYLFDPSWVLACLGVLTALLLIGVWWRRPRSVLPSASASLAAPGVSTLVLAMPSLDTTGPGEHDLAPGDARHEPG